VDAKLRAIQQVGNIVKKLAVEDRLQVLEYATHEARMTLYREQRDAVKSEGVDARVFAPESMVGTGPVGRF
jgi:hypothetical protein